MNLATLRHALELLPRYRERVWIVRQNLNQRFFDTLDIRTLPGEMIDEIARMEEARGRAIGAINDMRAIGTDLAIRLNNMLDEQLAAAQEGNPEPPQEASEVDRILSDAQKSLEEA